MGIVKLTRLRPFSVRDICEYLFDLVATISCPEFGHVGIHSMKSSGTTFLCCKKGLQCVRWAGQKKLGINICN